jgi:hypothetical protein
MYHEKEGGKQESSIIKNIMVYYEWTSRDNVTYSTVGDISRNAALLAEISSIWNRANDFYCHESFHSTFLSKRVYARRGIS